MEQNQTSMDEISKKLVKIECFMEKMQKYIEDLEFARSASEAWKDIENGNFKKMPVDKFTAEINALKKNA